MGRCGLAPARLDPDDLQNYWYVTGKRCEMHLEMESVLCFAYATQR
jgi:hypothetical protein